MNLNLLNYNFSPKDIANLKNEIEKRQKEGIDVSDVDTPAIKSIAGEELIAEPLVS